MQINGKDRLIQVLLGGRVNNARASADVVVLQVRVRGHQHIAGCAAGAHSAEGPLEAVISKRTGAQEFYLQLKRLLVTLTEAMHRPQPACDHRLVPMLAHGAT